MEATDPKPWQQEPSAPGTPGPRTEAEARQLLNSISRKLAGRDLVGELIRERRAWAAAVNQDAKDLKP